MKKKLLLLMFIGIFSTLYSCRDETEVNTDGDMEQSETRQVDDE